MTITNLTAGKVIGLGEVLVLPGETKEVPPAYASSPVLGMYENLGFARVDAAGLTPERTPEAAVAKAQEDAEAEKAAAAAKAQEDAEALRKARLAALEGISETDLGNMARDLGINPAACKDQADVLKKVRAALKK